MFNYNKMEIQNGLCIYHFRLLGLLYLVQFDWVGSNSNICLEPLGKEKIVQERCFIYFNEVVLFS